MFNIHDKIKQHPEVYKQLNCGDSLITLFHCLLQNKYEELWSHYNYVVYVVEGRKIWHTPEGSFDLKKGDCVFVTKGANIVEQFFDTQPCFILFFIPDAFIETVLGRHTITVPGTIQSFKSVMPVHKDALIETFFQSMMAYFNSNHEPDPALLELKFRELVLTLAGDKQNLDLRHFLSALMRASGSMPFKQIMEQNYCYNLKLEEFAQLTSRSLSAFKREFETIYHTTPGKWLLEKRLLHARHLLLHRNKTVAEAAFESGFENASHFSRVFRQRFGEPPASLRKIPAG